MNYFLRHRWIQVCLTGIIVAPVFTVVGILTGSNDPEVPLQLQSTVGEVTLATGGSLLQTGGDKFAEYGLGEQTELGLPGTATAAVETGWKDPALCEVGRGRYFQKDSIDEVEPYILMFNNSDNLIGIYLFSEIEKPLPWRHTKEITAVDFEHWGLFVYFQDPAKACTVDAEK